MVKVREKNHLQAWREFRGMTQEALGEAAGTTGSVVSLLESGERGLSSKWLRRLAPVLKTTPGNLLDHDPNDLPTDVLDAWAAIPEGDKPKALRMLKSLSEAA